MSCHYTQWFKNRYWNFREFKFVYSLSRSCSGAERNENAVLLACISVNHFKRTPYGEPDPEENPPRYPYTHPEYSLNLIPEDELKNTIGFGANYLTIGKILVISIS